MYPLYCELKLISELHVEVSNYSEIDLAEML